MAGVKISALPVIPSAPALTDIFPEVQPASGGTTYKTTFQQLYDLFSGTSGSINSGLINQVAYYAAAGKTLSGLATANSGVLITSAGGVPSISSTLPSTVQGNITTLGTQAAALNMGTHLINNVVNPVSNQDAATKLYVDSTAQGRLYKDPCVAATTGAFSATYANGSSGVGATLTGTVMAAFAPDGVTLAVGDRVLFKDQGSSFQNGIYTTTVLGTGAVLPVFTRALDMDVAAEFKGATTFVISGTANAGQTYTETATVVTVGTDAVTFILTGDAQTTFSIVIQKLAVNGTYTPTSGMKYCTVEIVGGGGSGGGVSGGTGGQAAAASGGSGAGYCRKTYSSALIGATAAVVVGAGGAGATSGANNGNSGSASTFTPSGGGVVLTANGGINGGGSPKSAAAAAIATPGTGGTGVNGDLNITGQDGGYGATQAAGALAISGYGGSSALGLGGRGNAFTVAVGSTGGQGTGYGAGSAGAAAIADADHGSNAGTNGICYITEYVVV